MASERASQTQELLREAEEAHAAFLRWQEIRIAHLGHVVNLVLTLTTASLGFGVKLILDKPGLASNASLYYSLPVLILAIAAGLATNYCRLIDFRDTARAARARELKRRQEAREAPTDKTGAAEHKSYSNSAEYWGHFTWWLLALQLLSFVMGISLLIWGVHAHTSSAEAKALTCRVEGQTFWRGREGVLQKAAPDCAPPNRKCGVNRYDVLIVGAGISGLSAARELRRLGRSVLILEANNRIGGRAYVGNIGGDKVPIDYGGAWLHDAPHNPLTGLVDAEGFLRKRTRFDLPYFINGNEATKKEKEGFDDAVKKYEIAVERAEGSAKSQYELAKGACSDYEKGKSKKNICEGLKGKIPISRLADLCRPRVRSPEEFCTIANRDLRVTSDVARRYVTSDQKYKDVIRLLIANAGPLESAVELQKTSAVEGAEFKAGDDDLVDQGMGAFVQKLGEGLPVLLNSRVTALDYSGDGVRVHAGSRVFEAAYALVTVSVEVLKKKKILFTPELPPEKLEAINHLQMGNMQKVIVPLNRDIFQKKPANSVNSWILYEGDLPEAALGFAKKQHLPLVNGKQVVMAFVLKPLEKNIAIGFFGGDWAKALEKRCENIEHSSGKSEPCDDLSVAITKSALSNISGEIDIDKDIDPAGIQITRWSLDATSFGAYSAAEPGNWYQREILAKPVPDATGTNRLFFAGEATARAMYNGSYPGAYESGLKAARDINAEMLEVKAKSNGGTKVP